jgi:hypothetical protein
LSDKKPDLGKNPFEAEIAANTAASTTFIAKSSKPNPRDINSDWFKEQAMNASIGLGGIPNLPGSMEVSFVPELSANKGPRELLESVVRSEIKTFGWPIGVTLQNRQEYRPRPTDFGIKAVVAIPESDKTGRSSYDYWALTREGDFYLRQSLFEDSRTSGKLFFNTRIIRVAEVFLFGANLFDNLGLSPRTRVEVRIRHTGLQGRVLASSSPSRALFEDRNTDVDQSEVTLELQVEQMREGVVECTRAICGPLFELFDFAQFAPSIYQDIVEKFVDGVVT